MAKVKEKIETGLTNSYNSFIRLNDRGSNTNGALLQIYVWQEICRMSAVKLKDAWASAQGAGGLIPNDDDLRDLGAGEHIVQDSNQFSVVAKVKEPARRFDAEKFVTMAAKKWKVSETQVLKLMDACRSESKAALEKRILEAA